MAHSLALTIRRLTIATLILIGTFAFSPLTRADISAPNPTASTNWFFIPQTSSGIDILGLEGEKVPFRASITNTSNNDGNPGTEMEYGGLGSIQNPGDIDFMSHYTDAPGVPGSPVIKPGTDNPQIYTVGTFDTTGLAPGKYQAEITAGASPADFSNSIAFNQINLTISIVVASSQAQLDSLAAGTALPLPSSSPTTDSQASPTASEQTALKAPTYPNILPKNIGIVQSRSIDRFALGVIDLICVILIGRLAVSLRRYPLSKRLTISLTAGFICFMCLVGATQYAFSSYTFISASDPSTYSKLSNARLFVKTCITSGNCTLSSSKSMLGYVLLKNSTITNATEIVIASPRYAASSLLHDVPSAVGSYMAGWQRTQARAILGKPRVLNISLGELPKINENIGATYTLIPSGNGWRSKITINGHMTTLGLVTPQSSSDTLDPKSTNALSLLAYDSNSLPKPYPSLIPTTWKLVNPDMVGLASQYSLLLNGNIATYQQNTFAKQQFLTITASGKIFNLQPDSTFSGATNDVLVNTPDNVGECTLGGGIQALGGMYYIVPKLTACKFSAAPDSHFLFSSEDLGMEFKKDSLSDSERTLIETYQLGTSL